MNRNRLFALAPLSLALLLSTAALAAPAGPPYTLKSTASADDAETDNSLFQLDFSITAPDGTVLSQISSITKERYAESTLAASNGAPTALRRTYEVASDRNINVVTGENKVEDSLQGKTVTIRRVDGKVVVRAAHAGLSDKDRAKLEGALDNTSREIYPDHPVSPGDTWTVPLNDLKATFAGADAATLTGTFVDVEQAAGYQCARLHLVIAASGKLPGVPATMKMTVEGDVLHALVPQRPVAVYLTGPIQVDGQGKIMGVDMTMKGSGTMTIAMKAVKFAGKAIVR